MALLAPIAISLLAICRKKKPALFVAPAQPGKQRPHPSVQMGIVHVDGMKRSQVARRAAVAKDAGVRIRGDRAQANPTGFHRESARAKRDGSDCEHALRPPRIARDHRLFPPVARLRGARNVTRPNCSVTVGCPRTWGPPLACPDRLRYPRCSSFIRSRTAPHDNGCSRSRSSSASEMAPARTSCMASKRACSSV